MLSYAYLIIYAMIITAIKILYCLDINPEIPAAIIVSPITPISIDNDLFLYLL